MDKQEIDSWTRRLPEWEVDRHIHILFHRGLIYVTNQKVACSTLKGTLWQWYIQHPECVPESTPIHRKYASPFKSPRHFGFRKFMSNINSSEFTRICFVRNPYTRLLSCYLDKIKYGKKQDARYKEKLEYSSDEEITFSAFVEAIASQSWYRADPHWRIQTEQLLWGDISYDFVGKFEFFRSEIDRLAVECGIDLRKYLLSRQGHAKHANRNMRTFYTEELQERVYEFTNRTSRLSGTGTLFPTPTWSRAKSRVGHDPRYGDGFSIRITPKAGETSRSIVTGVSKR